MALKKIKPTTPGQRHKLVVTNDDITASKPEKSLVYGVRKSGGRNNQGKMTILATLEVDKTVQFFVTTANVTHGHFTLIVTATAFTLAVHKALFRTRCGDVVVGDNQLVTLTGGCGFNFL